MVKAVPKLVLAAWAAALLIIAALVVAVVRYLGADGGHAHQHGAEAALTRAGEAPSGKLLGSNLLTAWHLDATALVVIVLLGAWYLTCVGLAGVRNPGTRWPWTRTLLFFLGLAVIGYATNGAVAVFDQALFTAHMVGHLLLVMLAPALLVAGRPLRLALLASTPSRAARLEAVATGRTVALLTAPPVALAAYIVAIVGTHLTGLMDVIMRNNLAGQVEHLVYVLVGVQFFVLIVGDEPIRWRLATPAKWLLLAVSMAVDTFTGIVLIQGTEPIYLVPTPGVSVNPLSDTQTGGAIMWIGGDGIMAAVMIALVLSWLQRVDTTGADRKGWLEQARRATYASHTGAGEPDEATFDDDDAARESYNAWLANLDKHR